ncbi:hypothetical protein NDU88_000842 [Pleurodeles waltl]|uniref:Uncharacterized protein n=1 Tax=Pleurodeles waltl TaxID=8319 RepID=A0AAV7SAN3_PLEWA|nr:hypothetical protein NDU88_000842 [Pleurodeles waltl]
MGAGWRGLDVALTRRWLNGPEEEAWRQSATRPSVAERRNSEEIVHEPKNRQESQDNHQRRPNSANFAPKSIKAGRSEKVYGPGRVPPVLLIVSVRIPCAEPYLKEGEREGSYQEELPSGQRERMVVESGLHVPIWGR